MERVVSPNKEQRDPVMVMGSYGAMLWGYKTLVVLGLHPSQHYFTRMSFSSKIRSIFPPDESFLKDVRSFIELND